MKSKIKGTQKSEYPCLKQAMVGDGKLVITLFTAPKTGTCVYSEARGDKLGEYSDDWEEKNLYTDFDGIMELSND